MWPFDVVEKSSLPPHSSCVTAEDAAIRIHLTRSRRVGQVPCRYSQAVIKGYEFIPARSATWERNTRFRVKCPEAVRQEIHFTSIPIAKSCCFI